jgi:hypothetical protein
MAKFRQKVFDNKISLDKEELDLIERIREKVQGALNYKGVIKMALEYYAAQVGVKIPPGIGPHLEPGFHLEPGIHLKPGIHLEIAHLSHGENHQKVSFEDLVKEIDLRTVTIAPDTLERLVPDKTKREKLLGLDVSSDVSDMMGKNGPSL